MAQTCQNGLAYRHRRYSRPWTTGRTWRKRASIAKSQDISITRNYPIGGWIFSTTFTHAFCLLQKLLQTKSKKKTQRFIGRGGWGLSQPISVGDRWPSLKPVCINMYVYIYNLILSNYCNVLPGRIQWFSVSNVSRKWKNHWRTEDLAFSPVLQAIIPQPTGWYSQGCLRSHSPCRRLKDIKSHWHEHHEPPKCSLLDIAGCWVHVASSLAIILATQLLELPHTSVTVSWSACYPSQRDLNATEKHRAGFSGPWDLASTARTACQICGLSG